MSDVITEVPETPDEYKFVVIGNVAGLVKLTEQDREQRARDEEAHRARRVENAIANVKSDASRQILERFPIWKQANMNARATELMMIKSGREWTEGEAAEAAKLQDAWAWIKSVRLASDEAEKLVC